MSKINILSSKIYNRIAAGEVVERPFSVVKELVENAIDAGANVITVEIENGGISLIKVTDNGCGIEESELKKAILPHATSKIAKLSDLDDIKSLGFRGEALASIASVSKMTIKSCPNAQEIGASIFVDGGEIIGDVEECGCIPGTSIEVANLFFNTPVRERFLHSARSEENEITSTMIKFMLGNPDVSFKYIANGKIIHQSFGDGLESTLVNIYGTESIVNSFLVNTQKNGISFYGYIGKHNYTKGNRSHQFVFINGRHVQNSTISSAIANAYSSYLMKRQYPFYALLLEIPTEIVDVNVHPNKLDVRFVNNQVIYGTIYSVISKVLDGTADALNIVYEEPVMQRPYPRYDMKKKAELDKYTNINYTEEQKRQPYTAKANKLRDDLATLIISDGTESLSSSTARKEIDLTEKKTEQQAVDIFAENKAYLESLERKKQQVDVQNTQIKIDRKLSVIGQALNTFIVLEDGQDMYFIDQHAAHERLLFDKLNKSLSENEIITQPLLMPFVLNVNSREFEFLCDKNAILTQMGIEISEFGKNAFKVSAVPAFLSEMNLQSFFNDVLSELDSLKDFTLNDLLIEKIAQKACKSAIKSGDKLSDLEIKTLMDMLQDNLGLKCPHGRPVAVKISRTEIDKWFKRII